MFDQTQTGLLCALSQALNGQPVGKLTDDIIAEARQQAVLSLISTNPESIATVAKNYQTLWEQQQVEEALGGIWHVVLKGAAAAVYYPYPLKRTFGDIDVLVRGEDYEAAKDALKANGYICGSEDERHVHFSKNNVIVELHRKFATLQTQKQEEMMDTWLFSDAKVTGFVDKFSFPMPSDIFNGLVLLAHINQHLEEGLGLRQLIDWIMYVNNYLDDAKWSEFVKKTDLLGLTKIAKVTARIGQKYMKLYQDLYWCTDVDDNTADALLDYTFECGNFGYKDAKNNTIIMVMSHSRGLKGFFRNLQSCGEGNWAILKKAPFLKPLAWLYQLCRYIKRGLRNGGLKNFRKNLAASRRRNNLMDELGARRLAVRK